VSELQTVAERVIGARHYWDLFPSPDSVKGIYRKLARVLHPDRYTGADQELAGHAFARLVELNAQAEKAGAAGTYGAAPLPTLRHGAIVHELEVPLGVGDITSLYRATSATKTGSMASVIKVARNAADNDLLATEAAVLKKLHAADSEWTRHYPPLLDTFLYSGGGARRRVNALPFYADMNTLDQVAHACGGAIPAVHIAWIWRRLLMALGYAHDQGIVHGAVTPPHIMLEPAKHAVMLIDWCYASVRDDGGGFAPIKLMVPDYRNWYPAEVTAKQPPGPATDIAMAAQTVSYFLGTKNARLHAFFRGCQAEKPSNRPANAWMLLKEFDDLLEALGEPFHNGRHRRFVEFVLPGGVA
jgi:serine/threonine protein kinase